MATATLATIGGVQFIVGNPGELASDPNSAKIESRVNENASAVDYGDVVMRGVAVAPGTIGNCKPFAASAIAIGIAVRQLSEANAASGNTVNYPQNKTVPILKDGDIWVLATEAVTEGDAGVVTAVGGVGGTTAGAANGTTRVSLPGSVWQQTVGSGSIGLLRVKQA